MTRTEIDTAVVLAAGAGSKFWPYNVVRQKAAFPIANQPLVRRIVEDLTDMDVHRIVVVVGHGEPSVRAALRGCAADLRFVRQPTPAGTADAVLQAAAHLDGDFLVVSGDVATARANLVALRERFQQERPPAAALIQPLGPESPQDWLVAYPEGDQLRAVRGHDRGGAHRLCGVYAFQPAVLDALRDNPGIVASVPVGGMPPLEAEIAQSLQMLIEEGHPVLAVESVDYHVDLDKPWHILEANARVLGGMAAQLAESPHAAADIEGNIIPASCTIHDGAEIHGRLVLGENVTIGNRVVIRGNLWAADNATLTNGAILEGDTVVGRQTTIKDYCLIGEQSSLGAQGRYSHGAEFSGVALDTVYCYHYCEIWGVVGHAVDFGAATVCGNLRFDDGETTWRVRGRMETPTHAANAAYFGDYCRTGVNAIIMPGRRIGIYSCVGPGVVAYDDVPDRQLVQLQQTLSTRPWGPERYGW
jgi:bifunctional UDP-N-acetylglucosamine pyrophosphorylase/glucosamine-1-phosphate N-acetyltransferase